MKKTRQAHLWIGLITSVLILMESITGLLLSEPWLMGGQDKGEMHGQMMKQGFNPSALNQNTNDNSSTTTNSSTNTSSQENTMPMERGNFGGKGNTSLFSGFVKGLHAGRIGNTDITWLIDLAAISMIFLTISGIYLSIKILMAQRKSKKRRAAKTN